MDTWSQSNKSSTVSFSEDSCLKAEGKQTFTADVLYVAFYPLVQFSFQCISVLSPRANSNLISSEKPCLYVIHFFSDDSQISWCMNDLGVLPQSTHRLCNELCQNLLEDCFKQIWVRLDPR